MSKYEESGFEFDFDNATASFKHEKQPPEGDGNTLWQGVDFRVIDGHAEVWIEVKSWSFKKILDKVGRIGAKKDYAGRLKANAADGLREEVIQKFLGTSSFMAWSRLGIPTTVTYIIFLEPPDRGCAALLGPFQQRLRNALSVGISYTWGNRIRYKVVDLAEFRREFPNYPVTRI